MGASAADRVFFTSVVVTRPSRTHLVTIRYLKPIPTHRNRYGITRTSHEDTELTSTLPLSKVQNTETYKNRHAFSYPLLHAQSILRGAELHSWTVCI